MVDGAHGRPTAMPNGAGASPRVPWATGVVLWIGAVLGALAVIPYAAALAGDGLAKAAQATGFSATEVVLISLAQSAVLLGVMTFAGLWAATRLGLGAPVVAALLARRPVPEGLGNVLLRAVAIGFGFALLIAALDRWVFLPLDPGGPGAVPPPAVWKGLLASLYGGIAEEVQLRLFLLSTLALALRWAGRRLGGDPDDPLPGWAFWTANVAAAAAFGLAHLPATAELVAVTPPVVVRAVVLNGVIAVALGWLYRRHGIEAAMTAHFTADVILHGLLAGLR